MLPINYIYIYVKKLIVKKIVSMDKEVRRNLSEEKRSSKKEMQLV